MLNRRGRMWLQLEFLATPKARLRTGVRKIGTDPDHAAHRCDAEWGVGALRADGPQAAESRSGPRPIVPRVRRRRVWARSSATDPHRRRALCRYAAWRASGRAARGPAR